MKVLPLQLLKRMQSHSLNANWYLFSIDGTTSWLSQTQQDKNRLCHFNSTNNPKVLDRVEPNTRRLFCGNKWIGLSSWHF